MKPASGSQPRSFRRVHELATRLYGAGAGAFTSRVEELARNFAATAEADSRKWNRAALDERDALLITYPDQLHEANTTPLRTLAGFCEAHLRDAVSGIHILPFYPWSSDDGFSVKDYLAVDPALGSWDDVVRFGPSFDLMFDAVFNHMSAQGGWFQRFLRDEPDFRDFFVTVEGTPDLSQVVRPRALPLLTEFQTARGGRRVWTTFSADQVDLNFRNPRVLLAVLEALLFYVAKRARFIRLDAIAFLWKEIGTPCLHLPQTHAVIRLMRALLDEVAPGVLLITETNVPHTDNLSYFGDGTNEAQLVYNFALPPLVLNAVATGRAAKLTRWAAGLRAPSDRTTFFNFLASHDGIGLNPARGILAQNEIDALVERTCRHGGRVSYKHNPEGSQSPYELNITWFDAVNEPGAGEPLELQSDRFMVSQAVMLALAGVPGIYFHSLFGSRNDRAGAEVSGIARRINRQKFERGALERELADPASLRARVLSRYRELLRGRRSCPAFHPQGGQEVLELDDRVFAVARASRDRREHVLCLHNLSGETVELALPPKGPLPASQWHCLTTSAAERRLQLPTTLRLRPYAVVWARSL